MASLGSLLTPSSPAIALLIGSPFIWLGYAAGIFLFALVPGLIMAYLSGADTADFNELKARIQTTDGNLSVHLRKLEEAGFVAVTKRFQGRKPQTCATLTDKGRQAFVTYLDAMQVLVSNR